MTCTLEELTSLLNPIYNISRTSTDNTSTEKQNQARVLETLLFLNDEGLIFLNSDTDITTITIKGLIKINDKVLYN